jgi:serine/threonine protein kinase
MQLIRHIGRGGFGNVDEVEDATASRLARKTFSVNQPGHFPADLVENVKKRFIREADVQSAVLHPNIMPVLLKNLTADPPWFLMPLASSSLDKDISASKNLAGNGIMAIMDILAGLEELHSMGITHRDLKPANVLRLDGSYVISDFGLMSIKDTQLSVLTQTGMRMGSDFYTAPEIVADLRQASAQSDIFSVGCILHDMYGTSSRVPCNEVNDSGHFAEVILGCTRRDPKRRFRSVTQLRDAILAHGHAAAGPVVEPQVKDYISLLSSATPIILEIWDRIVDKIEQLGLSADGKALLGNFSLSRIEELIASAPLSAPRFGAAYSAYVRNGSFNFDDCDGIANRLEALLAVNDLSCQSEVLLALLMMGTSHNRWYVERKFADRCGPSLPEPLARRIAMEMRIMGAGACSAISHLERSINVSRGTLHPILVSTLNLVCS